MEAEVGRVVDGGAVGQELLPDRAGDGVGRQAVVGHRVVEQLVGPPGLDVGEQRLLLHAVEVIGEHVDNLVAGRAELVSVHDDHLIRA